MDNMKDCMQAPRCGEFIILSPGLEVIKLFFILNRILKFQLLIKTKVLKKNTFLSSKLSKSIFIMLINVKMPTIVGILTFMSMINFVPS